MPLEQLWAGWRAGYVQRATAAERSPGDAGSAGAPECVFCRLAAAGDPSVDNLVLWRDDLCMAALNAFPYASGHMLVLPVRHVGTLDGLTGRVSALWRATRSAVGAVEAAYRPDGVNMGANLGRAAGAGLPDHLHLHVVPRWSGDTNFMTSVAGVRVLPEPLETAWAKLTAAWPSPAAVAGDGAAPARGG